MFGGVGFSLRKRAAVGMFPASEGLVMTHLAADDAGEWSLTESRIVPCAWSAGDDPAALSDCALENLRNMGWEKMPLALALPVSEAEIAAWELPVPLSGEELRAALLWSFTAARGEGVEMPSMQLCCDVMDDDVHPRYWTAQVACSRVAAFFAAFADAGLLLGRLTICPPEGGTRTDLIAQVRADHLPWESEDLGAAECAAVYAALLFRPDAPTHLYWSVERSLVTKLRAHVAGAIALTATALFLAATAVDAAAWMRAVDLHHRAEEELALRDGERQRMEELAQMQVDAAHREQLLHAFWATSLPLHALLVHLGQLPLNDVRLTAVRASAHEVFLEGETADFAALSALTTALEERGFFSPEVSLERVEQASAAEQIGAGAHFVLRAAWQEEGT